MHTSVATLADNWKQYIGQDEFTNYMNEIKKRFEKTSFYIEPTSDLSFAAPMGNLFRGFGSWMPGSSRIA